MLSILIPTYNYNIYPLVYALNQQAQKAGINYEIIAQDDGSALFLEENTEINSLENCRYELNISNLGRTQTRQILAQKALFDWVLFLDADVTPEKDNFIANYIPYLKTKKTVVFGGCKYTNLQPDFSKILRYKYGKNREEKSPEIRNQKPYQSVLSGNMLIQKDIFLEINFSESGNLYGMDIYFAYKLWQSNIPVKHIDNAIFHLGLEQNEVFFKKALQSVISRKQILENVQGIEMINPLLSKYKLLKNYRLTGIINFIFSHFEPLLKKKILCKDPNLLCFDLYRLGFICSLKSD